MDTRWSERLASAAQLIRARFEMGPAGVIAVAVLALFGLTGAIGVGVVACSRPQIPPAAASPTSVDLWGSTATSTTTTIPPLVVHVAGAVRAPGLYRLARGARVVDAIEVAGGVADGIDIDRVNLAAPVVDGQHLVLPTIGLPGPPAGGGDPSAGPSAPATPLDLNTATAAQLEALPGVGPATAAAILAQRDRQGHFESVDDLRRVKGIGESRLSALRDLVAVG